MATKRFTRHRLPESVQRELREAARIIDPFEKRCAIDDIIRGARLKYPEAFGRDDQETASSE